MPRSHSEEDRQQEEWGKEANVNFPGSPKPRNPEAVRDRIHDPFVGLGLHGLTRDPSVQREHREGTSDVFVELKTTQHCRPDSRINDKRCQRPSILLPYY